MPLPLDPYHYEPPTEEELATLRRHHGVALVEEARRLAAGNDLSLSLVIRLLQSTTRWGGGRCKCVDCGREMSAAHGRIKGLAYCNNCLEVKEPTPPLPVRQLEDTHPWQDIAIRHMEDRQ